MPKGTPVHRCYTKLKRKRGKSSAAAICQASTKMSLKTGKSLESHLLEVSGLTSNKRFNKNGTKSFLYGLRGGASAARQVKGINPIKKTAAFMQGAQAGSGASTLHGARIQGRVTGRAYNRESYHTAAVGLVLMEQEYSNRRKRLETSLTGAGLGSIGGAAIGQHAQVRADEAEARRGGRGKKKLRGIAAKRARLVSRGVGAAKGSLAGLAPGALLFALGSKS